MLRAMVPLSPYTAFAKQAERLKACVLDTAAAEAMAAALAAGCSMTWRYWPWPLPSRW